MGIAVDEHDPLPLAGESAVDPPPPWAVAAAVAATAQIDADEQRFGGGDAGEKEKSATRGRPDFDDDPRSSGLEVDQELEDLARSLPGEDRRRGAALRRDGDAIDQLGERHAVGFIAREAAVPLELEKPPPQLLHPSHRTGGSALRFEIERAPEVPAGGGAERPPFLAERGSSLGLGRTSLPKVRAKPLRTP